MTNKLYDRWKALLAKRRKARDAQLQRVRTARAKLTADQKRVDVAVKKVEHYKPKPARLAIKWAQGQIGTVEHPAGSNKGPKISDWQKHWLGYDGYSWCGAFVGMALEHAGVRGIVGSRIVYTPAIVGDGRAGANGMLKLVPWAERRPGDLVLYNWDGGVVDHVGIYVADSTVLPGQINTVEGNTSGSNSGSQSNGGGVFARTRPRSVVQYLVRPRYPA